MSASAPPAAASTPQTLFVLLDIDNTLYHYDDTGFGIEMHDRIFQFVAEKLGFSAEQAQLFSAKYYHDYGLSLHGYVKNYQIDAKEYSDYVHQCSYEKLTYNAPLVSMLRRLQFRDASTAASAAGSETPAHGNSGRHHLLYFTNANRPHARRVLTSLGLKEIFTRTRPAGSPINEHHRVDDAEGFDEAVEWLGFSYEDQWRLTAPNNANKPMREAYKAVYKAIDDWISSDEHLLTHQGASKDEAETLATAASPPSFSAVETAHRRAHLRPENVVMVDDSLMNLLAPLELGWRSVWFAHNNQQLPEASDVAKRGPFLAQAVADGRLKIIRDLMELESALDELAQ